MSRLIELYAKSCKYPLPAYQFLKLSEFGGGNGLIEVNATSRYNYLKTIDINENPKLDLKDYEYYYLTDPQKINYIKQHHLLPGLSINKYENSSDNVKIAYVKNVKLLGENFIKISSNKVLHIYIDTIEQDGNKGNLREILKTVNNPENIIYYIYNKQYKGYQSAIADKLTTMLGKTKHPDKLIAIIDKLLEQSDWQNSVSRLNTKSIVEILFKSVSPKKIFNMLTEQQKQTWYNVYSSHKYIFLALWGSKNSAEIFNIFGEDAVKAFVRLLTQNSFVDEKELFGSIDNIFKCSKEYDVKIPENYLKPIYKAILNSKLGFKILNHLKKNNLWNYFQKFTNDDSELGAEMGDLGF